MHIFIYNNIPITASHLHAIRMLTTYDWKQQFPSNCALRACRELPMTDYPDHCLHDEEGPSESRCGYGPLRLPKQAKPFCICSNTTCMMKHSRIDTFKCTTCFRARFCSSECRKSIGSKHNCKYRRRTSNAISWMRVLQWGMRDTTPRCALIAPTAVIVPRNVSKQVGKGTSHGV